MEKLVLKAVKKTDEKAALLIRDGALPAVIYGKGKETFSIILRENEFRKVLKQCSRHNVITLDVEGTKYDVLVKDFQENYIKDVLIHADFYLIDEKRMIKVPVPIQLTGESAATRLGALITLVTEKIKIKCLPKDIPESLQLDISPLNDNGDNLAVKDVIIPKGVELDMQDNIMVVKAEFPRAVAAETNASEEESSEWDTSEEKAPAAE